MAVQLQTVSCCGQKRQLRTLKGNAEVFHIEPSRNLAAHTGRLCPRNRTTLEYDPALYAEFAVAVFTKRKTCLQQEKEFYVLQDHDGGL